VKRLLIISVLLVGCSLSPQGYGSFVMEQCAAADMARDTYTRTHDEQDFLRAGQLQVDCMEGLKRLGMGR